MNPPKSPLMDTSSADPSEEQLPVVQVTGINKVGNLVVLVKWGKNGATQTSGEYGSRYDVDPYFFFAVDFFGEEPVIKAFSTLLDCNGGVLTIMGTRYRIQVTEPQQDVGQEKKPKRPRTSGTFTEPASKKRHYNFIDYINNSINNKNDAEIYEREEVMKTIFRSIKPIESSPKPICVTLWSGRGSGKTSMIRYMATKSNEWKKARDCGRLMIFDANRSNVLGIPKELASGDVAEIKKFLVALVAFHLCKIFKGSSVDGVEFPHHDVPLWSLWKRESDLPETLLKKLESTETGESAYEWWKSCTKSFLEHDEKGPDPIIIIDTAETLALEYGIESPRKKKTEIDMTPDSNPNPNPGSPAGIGITSFETKALTPHRHENGIERSRYLVLEYMMMFIPIHHVMIAFGTGQTCELPAPYAFQSHVNHTRVPPLNALSEKAAFDLFRSKQPQKDDRFVKAAYAVTAGIPRMLVTAFKYHKSEALRSTENEIWEQKALNYYGDSSRLIKADENTCQCLSKAILISAVCDVKVDSFDDKIPSEENTWTMLRWRSIAYSVGDRNSEGSIRIPRLLWQQESETIREWVKKSCGFDVNDLLPTVHSLYSGANDASALSSGVAWEKMFASALVARFFALCWMDNVKDIDQTYIGLDRLFPQENINDKKTLQRVEVCLAGGIIANSEKEAFVNMTREELNPKAIHANWEHKSAHHDMILPVRYKKDGSDAYYAVSARSGHHKTEKELLDTKQHLVNKNSTDEVAGIIQALHPRKIQTGRKLTEKFKELTEKGKYAEVIITKGHVQYVLGCFS